MTIREFYLSVINSDCTEEVTAKAQELLAALDNRNAKRKATPTKEQRESASRRESVLNFFYEHTDTPFDRDQIAAAIGISPAQVTSACKVLVDSDVIVRSKVKIDKALKVVYTMPHEE